MSFSAEKAFRHASRRRAAALRPGPRPQPHPAPAISFLNSIHARSFPSDMKFKKDIARRSNPFLSSRIAAVWRHFFDSHSILFKEL
jgi:hypothetical protein